MEEQKSGMQVTEDTLKELERIGRNLRERKSELSTELSLEDKKKVDIEHYVEFYQLSASQGYKASKMLKECLERRRNIKDEMELIDDMMQATLGFIGKGKCRRVIDKQSSRKYNPRVLNELFNS